jgi:hypothetical protein
MRHNKKGQMSIWDVLIWGLVVLVAAIIVIYGFRTFFTKETGIVGEQFKTCTKDGGTCKQSCEGTERILLGIYEDCKSPAIACCKAG